MSVLSGPIIPLQRAREADRAKEELPLCWLQAAGADGANAAERMRWQEPAVAGRLAPFHPLLDGDAGGAVTLATGGAIVFALAAQPPVAALKGLLEATDQGERVYVLASPGFGEGSKDPGLSQRRDARVLVRRVSGLPLSAVLSSRGREGFAWIGPIGEAAARFRLALNPDQGAALFQILLHLFWHAAEDEAWTGEGPLRFRKPDARPFDAPLPAGPAPVTLRAADAVEPLPAGRVWHSPAGALPASGRPDAILVPPSGEGQDPLGALARQGTVVCWDELGLPSFSVGEQGAALEVKSARWRARLELDAGQAEALRHLAKLLAEKAAWQLALSEPLGAVRGAVWLPKAKSAAKLVPAVTIPCEVVTAPALRAMTETEAREYPPPPPLALRVRWQWTVRPPRPPSGAKKDPLLDRWEVLDQQVKKRLDELADDLNHLESSSSSLSKCSPG